MTKRLALWLIRRLLVFCVDPHLRDALPKIFHRIDLELQFWLRQRCHPAQIEGLIASIVSDALGEKCTPTQLWLVRLLYDPVAAANHSFAKPRERPQ